MRVLVGHPALVAGAAGRVALHRAGQADAERLRGKLQWPPARRMPPRHAVHLAGPRPDRACRLAARLQQRQATLETGREAPPPRSPANVSGGMPPDTLPSHQTSIMKERDSTSEG